MAKVIDITEKLNFEEAPKLQIRDMQFSVNSDAPTMLKIMQKLGDEVSIRDTAEMYELLFPENERKKLEKLKLDFNDFQTLVRSAISLATGTDMDEVQEKE